MKTEIRSFDEASLADAIDVVTSAFSAGTKRLLYKILDNPARKMLGNCAAGEIAYQDGKPVAFQAAIVRRLFIGKQPIVGVVGSTLGALRETSPVLLMQLMKRTIAPRCGSVIFFANTANPTSMKMNRLLGIKGCGPTSCTKIRFGCVLPLPFLRWLLPRPHAVRIEKIEPELFNRFWNRYLEGNEGLVASRSAEELEWMFGNGLKSGTDVLLAHCARGELDGYVVFRETRNGKSWMIVDLIAIHNNKDVLLELVRSAIRFLRREKTSIVLECIGFPDFIYSVIGRALPFCRKTTNNSFLWKCFDGNVSEVIERSWFYGPYDGDRCL